MHRGEDNARPWLGREGCRLASHQVAHRLGQQGQPAAGEVVGPEDRTEFGHIVIIFLLSWFAQSNLALYSQARAQEHRDRCQVESERKLAAYRLA